MTPDEINARIDHETAQRVEDCASKSNYEMACDIGDLDGEWDIERALALTTSALVVPGIALAAVGKRAGLALPALAAAFAVQYAATGFSLPALLLRRFGIRTRREIDSEKFALKSLRGDFDAISSTTSVVARAGSALQAVTH